MLQPVTSPAPTNKPTQPTNKPVTPTNRPTTKPTKSSLHLNPDICGRRNAPIGISKRIVGGVDAKLQDWPWIGNLRQKSNPKKMCGLSIINQQYVLTAAHCLGMWGYPDKNDYQVRIGESHIGAMQTEGQYQRQFRLRRVQSGKLISSKSIQSHAGFRDFPDVFRSHLEIFKGCRGKNLKNHKFQA